jgi:Holliday junction resolvase
MLESGLQKIIIKKLRACGILAMKFDSTSTSGVPDLICIGPGGVFFIEVKTPRGVVSEIQKDVHREMRAFGAHVYVVRKVEEIEPIVQDRVLPG